MLFDQPLRLHFLLLLTSCILLTEAQIKVDFDVSKHDKKNMKGESGTLYWMYERHCKDHNSCKTKYCLWTNAVHMRFVNKTRYNPSYYCAPLGETETYATIMGVAFVLCACYLAVFWACIEPKIYQYIQERDKRRRDREANALQKQANIMINNNNEPKSVTAAMTPAPVTASTVQQPTAVVQHEPGKLYKISDNTQQPLQQQTTVMPQPLNG